MAASDHLNPQLFHGTSADLGPGDRVLPAREAKTKMPNFVKDDGRPYTTTRGRSARTVAFATTNEDTAWFHAGWSAGMQGGRASVLKVAPHPEQEMGLHNPNYRGFRKSYHNPIEGETIAPHFDVTERIDIKPGHQGTLPINWAQFHEGGSGYGDSANHPSDMDIKPWPKKVDGKYNVDRAMNNDPVAQRVFLSEDLAKERKARIEAPEQGRLF